MTPTSQELEPPAIPGRFSHSFVGDWILALDVNGETVNMDLEIADAEGSLAAEVGSDFGTARVTRIVQNGEALVLGYSMEMDGTMFPVVITLGPDTEGFEVSLDFDRGAFVASGKGTRR
jgi:hypothetical protein